jgi:hypothetical protein
MVEQFCVAKISKSYRDLLYLFMLITVTILVYKRTKLDIEQQVEPIEHEALPLHKYLNDAI